MFLNENPLDLYSLTTDELASLHNKPLFFIRKDDYCDMISIIMSENVESVLHSFSIMKGNRVVFATCNKSSKTKEIIITHGDFELVDVEHNVYDKIPNTDMITDDMLETYDVYSDFEMAIVAYYRLLFHLKTNVCKIERNYSKMNDQLTDSISNKTCTDTIDKFPDQFM